jgi:hypothetical protein
VLLFKEENQCAHRQGLFHSDAGAPAVEINALYWKAPALEINRALESDFDAGVGAPIRVLT